jgi:putative pyruvate formate lyase activating enzyme
MTSTHPSYLALAEAGELSRRAERLRDMVRACSLCPRQCGVDRTTGEKGYCQAGATARVASTNLHHGEEPPISGSRGSGTVFLSHCTMRCLFCQNYPISQLGNGGDATDSELAGYFLSLQERGAHNLNLVTPTHYLHAIVAALAEAVERGFSLPIVYNTSGYERVATLRLLEGIVDVYMPDIKYIDTELAAEYSNAEDYPAFNMAALIEMHRQVGELAVDAEGIATRGMLVRHLVLPGSEERSIEVLRRLSERVAPECYVSLMSQYFPAHLGPEHPPLDRRVDPVAYGKVTDWIETTRLRGWVQPAPEPAPEGG